MDGRPLVGVEAKEDARWLRPAAGRTRRRTTPRPSRRGATAGAVAGIAGRGELRPVDAFGARARRVAKVTECRLDASLALVPRAPSLAVPRARGRPLSPAVTPGTSADAMSQPEPHLAAVASANAGGRVALYPTADLAGQLAGRRAPATVNAANLQSHKRRFVDRGNVPDETDQASTAAKMIARPGARRRKFSVDRNRRGTLPSTFVE